MELILSLEKQYFSNGEWGLIVKQEANFVGHTLLFFFKKQQQRKSEFMSVLECKINFWITVKSFKGITSSIYFYYLADKATHFPQFTFNDPVSIPALKDLFIIHFPFLNTNEKQDEPNLKRDARFSQWSVFLLQMSHLVSWCTSMDSWSTCLSTQVHLKF